MLAGHERRLAAARGLSEPAGQIAARGMEIVRIKGALQRAEELSDDVAAAIEDFVKWLWHRVTLALMVGATALHGFYFSSAGQHSRNTLAIFDSDPNHIWNRTYSCLFVRQNADGKQYGEDALDPLLWPTTRYLLKGDSHRRVLACLDEFLNGHAERAVQDPLRHAILQRDLWAVFDWVAAGDDSLQQRRELESRLAEVIQRLALVPEQVESLPDTYDAAVAARQFASAYDPHKPQQPFLPPDLFRKDGPWVCLSAHSEEPTAIVHFSGRSQFFVFMRLPGGRDATLAYIEKLRSSSQPAVLMNDSATLLNLALPQFPVGTEVALVRQLIVISNVGKLVPTRLTESVQLRVYHSITPGTQYMNYINGPSSHDQDFFEFRMSRVELFAHRGGGLVAVGPGQSEFAMFSTHGIDAFESRDSLDPESVILKRCRGCHSDSGIHSVQSRVQWMKRPSDISGQVGHDVVDDPIAWETRVTVTRKEQQSDFKLLQTLWRDERH
jgi:hypothetical protein